MRDAITITCHLDRVRYENGDGFVVLDVIGQGRAKFPAVGSMARPEPGLDYEITGRWDEHSRFGKQFKFHSYRTVEPNDLGAIERYLSRVGKGFIGKAIAARIVEALGETAIADLREKPEDVFPKVRGLSLARATALSTALRDRREEEDSILALEKLLGGLGLRRTLPMDVFIELRGKAVHALSENPYRLTEFRGVGFLSADRVAMRMGFDKASMFRQAAAVRHVLSENESAAGNTWMIEAGTIEAAMEAVQGVPVIEGLSRLMDRGEVVRDGQGLLALAKTANQEASIASKIVRLACSPTP
ncbi:MAG: helix-hairpin-helix domain-containing protein [Pseudomonadota bacterium]